MVGGEVLWPFVVVINAHFGKHCLSAGAISFPISLLPLQHTELEELKAKLPVRMMELGFYCMCGGPGVLRTRVPSERMWQRCAINKMGGPVACTVQCWRQDLGGFPKGFSCGLSALPGLTLALKSFTQGWDLTTADAIWSGSFCGIAGLVIPPSLTWKPGGQSEPAWAGGKLWEPLELSQSFLQCPWHQCRS